MKVKELIEKLKEANPESDVYIPNYDGKHDYYIVNSVYDKILTVLDDNENVVIIDFE